MKRMLIGVMVILVWFAASTVSMAQMGSQAPMGSQSSNPGPNNQDKKHGLNRANEVNAGKVARPGQQGRDNAAAKQDVHKPGGSGVPPTGGSGGGTDPCLGC